MPSSVNSPATASSQMTGNGTYVSYMVGPAERTDSQVVRDVISGERDAYRLLVRRFGGVLYNHAVRMVGSQDDAADLVQRTLVSGYQKLSSCRDPDRVGAWLFRILSNLAKDHMRGRRRRDISLDSVAEIPEPGRDPFESAHLGEVRNRLRVAMGSLTPEQREAFLLKHVEGRSYEEMAAVLDVSRDSLKMRVHRAREALKELLEDYR
ncbi:MAG: RNA polymerase sigma factor [Longimicrobiales bacterium]|nr:RNA polymerase sigma factor [Longimicrobiales bacterium]